jgi:hypothetical protein
VADTAAPSVPSGLVAITPDVHALNVQLTWTAPTDNVGVTGYGIYRRQVDPSAATQPAFLKIADSNASAATYTDANVPAGTYDYAVDAVDSAGNRSAQSASAQVVTALDPPAGSHQIIPFPARDFVSSTGYDVVEGPITIAVLRPDPVSGAYKNFAVSTPISVAEDPATPGKGAVEVNHPGGASSTSTASPTRPPSPMCGLTGRWSPPSTRSRAVAPSPSTARRRTPQVTRSRPPRSRRG